MVMFGVNSHMQQSVVRSSGGDKGVAGDLGSDSSNKQLQSVLSKILGT